MSDQVLKLVMVAVVVIISLATGRPALMAMRSNRSLPALGFGEAFAAGIFLGVGSLCYALGIMVLLKLLILTLFCLLIGIFYLFLAVFYLPHTPRSIENPFYEVESKDCLSQKDNTLDSGNSSD